MSGRLEFAGFLEDVSMGGQGSAMSLIIPHLFSSVNKVEKDTTGTRRSPGHGKENEERGRVTSCPDRLLGKRGRRKHLGKNLNRI